jgi:hypothetical protein
MLPWLPITSSSYRACASSAAQFVDGDTEHRG